MKHVHIFDDLVALINSPHDCVRPENCIGCRKREKAAITKATLSCPRCGMLTGGRDPRDHCPEPRA